MNELFSGQYNDKYKEISLEYNVKLNFVVLKETDEEKINEWFKQALAALQAGVQIQKGNVMQRITVEKINK